jgi:hypothetical protein
MEERQLADQLVQLDRLRRRFPEHARCADCGASNPLLLCPSGRLLRCYQCRLKHRGLSVLELHHLGGRPSTMTATVPANPHRLLTPLQELWRDVAEPGSRQAQMFDLVLLRVLAPSFEKEGWWRTI